MSNFLSQLVGIVWGVPLLILLMGGGILLLCYSRFLPLTGFRRAFRLLTGKEAHIEEGCQGQISHFQALSNALAATIGLGNIAGVAIAITQGGPGAIFWMWVAALVGMNTKFYECTLAVMYRGRDYLGEVQGGPMYVIKEALPKPMHFLAILFAVFGLVGTLALFQINQLAGFLEGSFSLPAVWVGGTLAVVTLYILKGGIRRIAAWTSKMVPLMGLFYFLCGIVIIALNYEKVPSVFVTIFTAAFSGKAAFGGAMGYGVLQVFQIGMKRAAFSNEAGVGTAPMAHGNARTSRPVDEGYVAMLGPFFDTIIICTITALVILMSLSPEECAQSSGIMITTAAFEKSLPGFGRYFLGVAVFLFSFSTIIGLANYNEKCWNFLFKGRRFLKRNTFVVFYTLSVVGGAVFKIDDVVNLIDIAYALMAIPNLIAVIYLAKRVKV